MAAPGGLSGDFINVLRAKYYLTIKLLGHTVLWKSLTVSSEHAYTCCPGHWLNPPTLCSEDTISTQVGCKMSFGLKTLGEQAVGLNA